MLLSVMVGVHCFSERIEPLGNRKDKLVGTNKVLVSMRCTAGNVEAVVCLEIA